MSYISCLLFHELRKTSFKKLHVYQEIRAYIHIPVSAEHIRFLNVLSTILKYLLK